MKTNESKIKVTFLLIWLQVILAYLIASSLTGCQNDEPLPTVAPSYPCGLTSPSANWLQVRPLIIAKCAIDGCHNSSMLGNYVRFDDVNTACNDGSFAKQVLYLKKMPPNAPLDSCELILLRRWYMYGHLPN